MRVGMKVDEFHVNSILAVGESRAIWKNCGQVDFEERKTIIKLIN